jgi:hypothetical protein
MEARARLADAVQEESDTAAAYEATAEAGVLYVLKAEKAARLKELRDEDDALLDIAERAKAARKAAKETAEYAAAKGATSQRKTIEAAVAAEERRLAEAVANGSK